MTHLFDVVLKLFDLQLVCLVLLRRLLNFPGQRRDLLVVRHQRLLLGLHSSLCRVHGRTRIGQKCGEPFDFSVVPLYEFVGVPDLVDGLLDGLLQLRNLKLEFGLFRLFLVPLFLGGLKRSLTLFDLSLASLK